MTYRAMPEDYKGPICAECRYQRETRWIQECKSKGNPVDARDYICDAFDPELVAPASRDPITGEVESARLKWVRCVEKNDEGQCDRFEGKIQVVELRVPDPSPVSTRTEGQVGTGRTRRRRGPLRQLAARLGAWLTRWSDR